MNLIGENILSKPLKELVHDMHQGINTVTEKVEYLNDGIPIIQSKHITKGFLHFEGARFLSLEAYEKYNIKYQPKVDDLLVCNIGTIGKSLRIDKENQFLIAWNLFLIKIKKEQLYSSFFAHFLNYLAYHKYFDRFLTGGTVKFINKKTMGNIPIPLPPLDQQKKIAAILDAADAYRQKTKTLIEKYDELTQSLFLDMFGDPVINPKGWRKHKLGDISHMKAGKFVKAADIVSENNSNMYSCFGGNGLRGYVESFTHEGEFLLIGRQGALCGNVKKVKGKFHATEHAIVCSPTMEYETLWLYYMLVMINLNKYATGAAQPGLNVGTLVELEVMFAPYALQNQFAERVQAIEAQKTQAQASLAGAEDLFNSLLQRAFKGELV